MSVHVSVHLGSCKLSRQTYALSGDHWGAVYLDEGRDFSVSGSAAEWRALADLCIELADDIDFRAAIDLPLSASEVQRREAVRQEQRLRLLADRLERGESA